ncbi:HGxxPAAW family protein [Streptomyces longwoodensis]|uniref:HGxxPAAW family protein n=1 Tax=Streptomyces longwoodensis TaxID=68231 RepID=UPI00340B895F
MSVHPYDEGHTVAGWTGVAIATVGTSVMGVGVCTVSPFALVLGGVIDVLALLVTWALHLSGWGKPPGIRPRAQWSMRVRDPHAREGHPECLGCRLAGRGRGHAASPEVAPSPVAPSQVAPSPVASPPLSVPPSTLASDGTGMEVRGAALVGGQPGADLGRGAS